MICQEDRWKALQTNKTYTVNPQNLHSPKIYIMMGIFGTLDSK